MGTFPWGVKTSMDWRRRCAETSLVNRQCRCTHPLSRWHRKHAQYLLLHQRSLKLCLPLRNTNYHPPLHHCPFSPQLSNPPNTLRATIRRNTIHRLPLCILPNLFHKPNTITLLPPMQALLPPPLLIPRILLSRIKSHPLNINHLRNLHHHPKRRRMCPPHGCTRERSAHCMCRGIRRGPCADVGRIERDEELSNDEGCRVPTESSDERVLLRRRYGCDPTFRCVLLSTPTGNAPPWDIRYLLGGLRFIHFHLAVVKFSQT